MSWEFNGREESTLVLTYVPAGYQEWVKWNSETMDWEPTEATWEEDRYIINAPASIALTELQHRGDGEQAYKGLDYLDDTLDGTGIAQEKWWAELRMPHSTHYNWVRDHSVYLT